MKRQVTWQAAEEGDSWSEDDDNACNEYHNSHEYECLADVMRGHWRYCISDGICVVSGECRGDMVDVLIAAGYLIWKPI